MRRRVLRPCDVCKRPYDAAYLAELPTGTVRLCRSCWQTLVGDTLAPPTTHPPSGEPPPLLADEPPTASRRRRRSSG